MLYGSSNGSVSSEQIGLLPGRLETAPPRDLFRPFSSSRCNAFGELARFDQPAEGEELGRFHVGDGDVGQATHPPADNVKAISKILFRCRV